MFPLPFTWIFRDLSKFIFEPYCVHVFRKYLKEKEKASLFHLDEIMRIYLNSFKVDDKKHQDGSQIGTFFLNSSESTAKQIFLEHISRLQESFERFKKTEAFSALYLRVKEFEEISERVYN